MAILFMSSCFSFHTVFDSDGKGVDSGGSSNFKTGGGGSRRGRIFRPGVCFDAPSHIPYVLVARVVNKIHNVNIVID